MVSDFVLCSLKALKGKTTNCYVGILCEHCRGVKLLNLFIPSGDLRVAKWWVLFFLYLELLTEQCNLLLSIWIPLPGRKKGSHLLWVGSVRVKLFLEHFLLSQGSLLQCVWCLLLQVVLILPWASAYNTLHYSYYSEVEEGICLALFRSEMS